MKFYKKALLVLITLILFYVFYGIINKKKGEGFSFFTTPDSQITSLQSTKQVKIQTMNTTFTSLPLKEFYIKASYNTALTGRYINKDMVKYVLSRGCRFLDFEIYLVNDKVYVGASSDINSKTLDTENSILVDTIFNTIMTNAFTTQTSPNNGDPLFINLRIKTTDPTTYSHLAKSIDYNLKEKLYGKPVTKETKLSAIMGSIIIIVDKTINPDYVIAARCPEKKKHCIDLNTKVNLESGSEDLFLQRYSDLTGQYGIPIYTMNDNMRTNVQNMYLVLPDYGTKSMENPDYIPLIKKHGSQITPYRFYNNDNGLKKYEDFFDDNKAAFVSMAQGLRYINKDTEKNAE